MNREGHQDFSIPRGLWRGRQPGLSAMVRLKNEEEWIEPSLLSIKDWFDEIVVTLQNSTDRTEEIIRRMNLPNVRIFSYPFDSYPNGPGHDLYPADSVHARSYYYNWSLAKTTRQWVCKWDGDMVAMDWLGDEVRRRLKDHDAILISGINLAGETARHLAQRSHTAAEPRFFRVRPHVGYRPGSHCEVLSLGLRGRFRRKPRMAIIDRPAFLHFKWAKPFASASKAWPLNWRSIAFFRELAEEGTPQQLYEGERPSVLGRCRHPAPPAGPDKSATAEIFLFVSCTRQGGASLLCQLLERCRNLVPLRGEDLSPAADERGYAWPAIRSAWRARWQSSGRYADATPPVLLESSPSNIFRTASLERHFRPAHFLIMARSPYAVAEEIRRREGGSLASSVEHWIRAANRQLEDLCARRLTAWFSYEELLRDPRAVETKIRGVVPGLDDIDLARNRAAASNLEHVAWPARGATATGISGLSGNEIRALSRQLKPHGDLLRFWGYELL